MKGKKRIKAHIWMCEDEFAEGGIKSIAIDAFAER
jgi:hypothetical protein